MSRTFVIVLSISVFIASCSAQPTSTPTATFFLSEPEVEIVYNPTLTPSPTTTPATLATVVVAKPTGTPPHQIQTLDPNDWKSWSVIPAFIDPSLQKVYQYGLSRGNDPHAFSIFGDCQTQPDDFFGIFETDPTVLMFLSPELRETVTNFKGSFNRETSTSQDGTTPGALLWTQWHRGEYDCTFAETPVECELRTHRPSFVIIQVGTHFESRNTEYLRRIINQLLDEGVIPILATKADNREKDERINRDMALLASEYDLPLWNFWAAVSDLPNRGLYTRSDRPLQGDIYLTEEAAQRHRITGLEALDAVWRAVTGK
ncbi:MAG TPA: SGNH/GDSL hydrolase family protein [Anaerolineales bacterium]